MAKCANCGNKGGGGFMGIGTSIVICTTCGKQWCAECADAARSVGLSALPVAGQ